MVALSGTEELEDLQKIPINPNTLFCRYWNISWVYLHIVEAQSPLYAKCLSPASPTGYRSQINLLMPPCCVFTGVTWLSMKAYHLAGGTLQGEGKQNSWQVTNTLFTKRTPTCAGRFSTQNLIPPATGFEMSTWTCAVLNPRLPPWVRLVRTVLTWSLTLH